jgi:hypothetical protein
MSSDDNNSGEDESSLPEEVAIPRIVRFWIILPLYIPSVICSLFVLYHFVVKQNLRNAIHNHVITLLLFINLIVQLTSIPWMLSYYCVGEVPFRTPLFCMIWMFIDEALYITITVLFAWATIERHILIFHYQLVATKNKFIFVHCFPIVLLLLYCLIYNIITIIAPPCNNEFYYTQFVCGYPLCYYERHLVAMWDVIVNDMIPTIIIIVCSITLLLRFLYQKTRMHQPIHWRKHRKMAIQLLSISALYLVIYIPEMLMEFIHLCGVNEDVGADFVLYAKFFMVYGNILLPFVCVGSMPELITKIKSICSCWRRQARIVGPETVTVSRQAIGR